MGARLHATGARSRVPLHDRAADDARAARADPSKREYRKQPLRESAGRRAQRAAAIPLVFPSSVRTKSAPHPASKAVAALVERCCQQGGGRALRPGGQRRRGNAPGLVGASHHRPTYGRVPSAQARCKGGCSAARMRAKKKAQSQGLRLNPPKEEVLEETSDWHPTCRHYAWFRRHVQELFCCFAKSRLRPAGPGPWQTGRQAGAWCRQPQRVVWKRHPTGGPRPRRPAYRTTRTGIFA